MHEKILKPLRKTAKNIKAWWNFTGKPEPSEEEILDSLKRLVSGVLTHPVTIGEAFYLGLTLYLGINNHSFHIGPTLDMYIGSSGLNKKLFYHGLNVYQ